MIDRIIQPLEQGIARQLGHPEGRLGTVVGRVLNRANRRLVAAAVDAADIPPGSTAADIGFGGGAGLAMLLPRVGPEGHVHGVEIAEKMVTYASRRLADPVMAGRLSLHHAQMSALPIPDSTVAAVITVNTVYFVDNLTAAAAELARVLLPDGRAVIGIRDPEAMKRRRVTRHGFHVRSTDDLVGKLAAGGLELLEHHRLGSGVPAGHLFVTRPAT